MVATASTEHSYWLALAAPSTILWLIKILSICIEVHGHEIVFLLLRKTLNLGHEHFGIGSRTPYTAVITVLIKMNPKPRCG